jgi:hypothetical protein
VIDAELGGKDGFCVGAQRGDVSDVSRQHTRCRCTSLRMLPTLWASTS